MFHGQRFKHTSAEEGSQAQLYVDMGSSSVANGGHIDKSKWTKFDSRIFGISRSIIPQASWVVLKILRSEGFQAYLVGGCVRDLLLNKTPKDFDVITTAKLKQIKKQFHHAEIVGRRFPICKVHIKGSVIEVSSFDTVAERAGEKEKVFSLKVPKGCDENDFIRWRNSICRDFTINALFFDPFANTIYDYANGMVDLRSLKLRTLIPAQLSFKEDCARILRGLRIAARLGLSLSKETDTAIHNLSSSVQSLDKGRIGMELNYMLSYGAAAPSLCLLQRYNLLEMLLPFHAAYLQEAKQSAKSSTMLMKLFFYLDKVVTCDRPSDCSLWMGLLAFNQALVNNPQEALVILTFASVLYHGSWKEGVKFAKTNARMQVNFAPEILGSSDIEADEELAEAVTQLASLVQDSIVALTETESLFKSMSRFPVSQCSGFVFISKKMGKDVAEIFNVLLNDIESYNSGRKSFEIDYHLLGRGFLNETRFVLGKIILETMSEVVEGGMEGVKVEETHLQPDFTKENYGLALSDFVKPRVVKDRNHKRGLSESSLEPQHGKVKKQKLVKKKSNSLSKQEVDDMVKCLEVGEKHQTVIKTGQLPQVEANMTQGIMVERENCQLPEMEVTKEMQEDVENVEKDKRHLKVVEKMLSQDKVTKKDKVLGSRNLRREAKTKQKKMLEKEGLAFSSQVAVKGKRDEVLVKENSSKPLLSSLFK
ncbi:uncharacterized protein LOC109014131 isoform X2 [Juglans regia]|uniref:Uncharacterized protein LOC109014131 isoform X2 n=1 Tax=Juglans regia TaxID=51240 RepID=A0A2I4H7A6_JUGRE|nr:uncharacterized protein LOC109014131 isoform X2 [Juglans regia]